MRRTTVGLRAPHDGRLTETLASSPTAPTGLRSKACTSVVGERDAGLTTEASVKTETFSVRRIENGVGSSTGLSPRLTRHLLPTLLLVFSGVA